MATVIRGDDNFDTSENGRVLQVGFSNAPLKTGTWNDTAQYDIVSVSFTPLSATSSVYIEATFRQQSYGNSASTQTVYRLKILQDSTDIWEATSIHHENMYSNTAHRVESQTLAFKRATGSTSTRVYKMAVKNTQGRLNVVVSNYGAPHIKITEVEA